jgi:hypothetical protein
MDAALQQLFPKYSEREKIRLLAGIFKGRFERFRRLALIATVTYHGRPKQPGQRASRSGAHESMKG